MLKFILKLMSFFKTMKIKSIYKSTSIGYAFRDATVMNKKFIENTFNYNTDFVSGQAILTFRGFIKLTDSTKSGWLALKLTTHNQVGSLVKRVRYEAPSDDMVIPFTVSQRINLPDSKDKVKMTLYVDGYSDGDQPNCEFIPGNVVQIEMIQHKIKDIDFQTIENTYSGNDNFIIGEL